MADSNGNGVNGLPQWARIVALVGIPGAIALYLVYALTSFATAGVAELHRQMDAHAQVMVSHDADGKRAIDTMTRILYRICLNTAETATDRQRCVSDR